MRLIEQFFQALTKILFKKTAKNYDGALAEISLTYKKLFGLDGELINSLPYTEIIKMLELGGGFEREKALIIAELIKEEGEVKYLQNHDEDVPDSYYMKALNIYLYALKDGDRKNIAEKKDKIDFLIKKLDDYEFDNNLKAKVFRYFEYTGRYADAENLLFELIESGDAQILNEGVLFYKRLLNLSDNELNDGNLPRIEVEQGLKIVEAKLFGGLN